MSLLKHKHFQESGDPHLGRIPKHWRAIRLKNLAAVFPSNVDKKSVDGETPVLLCNYTDVYYHSLITPGLQFMAATATDDQIERFTLRKGDVIITKDSETADDIGISALVDQDLPGVVCGYHLSVIRAGEDLYGPFAKYVFDSCHTRATLAVRACGVTRVGLSTGAIDTLLFPVPPFEEQVNIAEFVASEVAKIDLLAETQARLPEEEGANPPMLSRLVRLLKERRAALITAAVTGQIDVRTESPEKAAA